MDEKQFSANQAIFEAGDPATAAYLIQEGKVQLLRGSKQVAVLGPGDVFGEMSLIQERPHAVSARANTSVRTFCVGRSEFERLLSADPDQARPFLNGLFERLRLLSDQAGSAGMTSASKKKITVTIHPLTRKAATTLPQDGLEVSKFPFRIGRAATEGEKIPHDVNDLWLIDEPPFSVSRNHACIELDGDSVVIKDRGSSLGVIVNEEQVGGNSRHQKAVLEDGDNAVILGGHMSRYQFRITVDREA